MLGFQVKLETLQALILATTVLEVVSSNGNAQAFQGDDLYSFSGGSQHVFKGTINGYQNNIPGDIHLLANPGVNICGVGPMQYGLQQKGVQAIPDQLRIGRFALRFCGVTNGFHLASPFEIYREALLLLAGLQNLRTGNVYL